MRDDQETRRGDRVQLALGAIALLAALVLVVTSMLNRSLQAQVAAGQAKIANAQAAANVNNGLIRLLAKSAAETGDPQIRTLLAQNGITYQPTAGAGAAAVPPAATPAQ